MQTRHLGPFAVSALGFGTMSVAAADRIPILGGRGTGDERHR